METTKTCPCFFHKSYYGCSSDEAGRPHGVHDPKGKIERIRVGSKGTPAPVVPGWACLQGHGTGGGAHQSYWYGKKGVFGIDDLFKFLTKHLASNLSAVKLEGEKIVVYSAHLGVWIGRSGAWAKAYHELGVKVEFKEVVALEVCRLSQRVYDRLKEKALFDAWIIGPGPSHNQQNYIGVIKEEVELVKKYRVEYSRIWKEEVEKCDYDESYGHSDRMVWTHDGRKIPCGKFTEDIDSRAFAIAFG